MEEKEKIIDRIENLLALAGNNPNRNEAEAAALKVQELMAKYNIVPDGLGNGGSGEKISEAEYVCRKKGLKWKHILCEIVARNFRCKCYISMDGSIVFYGYQKDAGIAVSVFQLLFETGNKLAHRHYQKCRKEGKATKGVMNAYLMGFCDGICEVLDSQSTALMVVIPEKVEESWKEFSKKMHFEVTTLKMTGGRTSYKEGLLDGRVAAMSGSIEG